MTTADRSNRSTSPASSLVTSASAFGSDSGTRKSSIDRPMTSPAVSMTAAAALAQRICWLPSMSSIAIDDRSKPTPRNASSPPSTDSVVDHSALDFSSCDIQFPPACDPVMTPRNYAVQYSTTLRTCRPVFGGFGTAGHDVGSFARHDGDAGPLGVGQLRGG